MLAHVLLVALMQHVSPFVDLDWTVLTTRAAPVLAFQFPPAREQPGPPTQPAPAGEAGDTHPPSGDATAARGESSRGAPRSWASVENVLMLAMLGFAAVSLLLVTPIVIRSPATWQPHAVLRLFGLIFIVTAAVVLVTAGYSPEQISAVIGLLGTVAGYLLGSREGAKVPADK